MLETIDTERLILRLITPESYDFIFSGSDEQAQKLLGLANAEALDAEKKKYAQGLRTHNRSFRNFLLVDKSTDKVVGHCGFHTWYLDHFRAEIGYALQADEHKNKGFMSEAMAVILRYGFEVMQLHRVEAFVGPNNRPSLQLMAKFGFRQEGHMREHYLRAGQFEDSLIFALFARDFSA